MKTLWILIIILAIPAIGISQSYHDNNRNKGPVLNLQDYERDIQKLYNGYKLPVTGEYYLADDSKGLSSAYGWKLFKKSRNLKALKVFEKISRKDPSNGEHIVGYASSAALLDRLAEGVVAMRKALSIDAQVLDRIQVDNRLKIKFSQVAAKYQPGSNALSEDDNRMMQTVFLYLGGDAAIDKNELRSYLTGGPNGPKYHKNMDEPYSSDTKSSGY